MEDDPWVTLQWPWDKGDFWFRKSSIPAWQHQYILKEQDEPPRQQINLSKLIEAMKGRD